MPEEPKGNPSWVRLSGIGIELVGAVAGFTLAGYWIDRYFGMGHWGLFTGLVLGLVGGMYNLIRQSLRASREADSSQRESDGEGR